jgi:hypothetical protein
MTYAVALVRAVSRLTSSPIALDVDADDLVIDAPETSLSDPALRGDVPAALALREAVGAALAAGLARVDVYVTEDGRGRRARFTPGAAAPVVTPCEAPAGLRVQARRRFGVGVVRDFLDGTRRGVEALRAAAVAPRRAVFTGAEEITRASPPACAAPIEGLAEGMRGGLELVFAEGATAALTLCEQGWAVASWPLQGLPCAVWIDVDALDEAVGDAMPPWLVALRGRSLDGAWLALLERAAAKLVDGTMERPEHEALRGCLRRLLFAGVIEAGVVRPPWEAVAHRADGGAFRSAPLPSGADGDPWTPSRAALLPLSDAPLIMSEQSSPIDRHVSLRALVSGVRACDPAWLSADEEGRLAFPKVAPWQQDLYAALTLRPTQRHHPDWLAHGAAQRAREAAEALAPDAAEVALRRSEGEVLVELYGRREGTGVHPVYIRPTASEEEGVWLPAHGVGASRHWRWEIHLRARGLYALDVSRPGRPQFVLQDNAAWRRAVGVVARTLLEAARLARGGAAPTLTVMRPAEALPELLASAAPDLLRLALAQDPALVFEDLDGLHDHDVGTGVPLAGQRVWVNLWSAPALGAPTDALRSDPWREAMSQLHVDLLWSSNSALDPLEVGADNSLGALVVLEEGEARAAVSLGLPFPEAVVVVDLPRGVEGETPAARVERAREVALAPVREALLRGVARAARRLEGPDEEAVAMPLRRVWCKLLGWDSEGEGFGEWRQPAATYGDRYVMQPWPSALYAGPGTFRARLRPVLDALEALPLVAARRPPAAVRTLAELAAVAKGAAYYELRTRGVGFALWPGDTDGDIDGLVALTWRLHDRVQSRWSSARSGPGVGATGRREVGRRHLDLLRRAADSSVGVLDRCARRWLLGVMVELAQEPLDDETRRALGRARVFRTVSGRMVCLDEMPRPIRCLKVGTELGGHVDLITIEFRTERYEYEDTMSEEVLVPDKKVMRLFDVLGVGAPRWV